MTRQLMTHTQQNQKLKAQTVNINLPIVCLMLLVNAGFVTLTALVLLHQAALDVCMVWYITVNLLAFVLLEKFIRKTHLKNYFTRYAAKGGYYEFFK